MDKHTTNTSLFYIIFFPLVGRNIFTTRSVLRQVHSLFQSQFSTECDLLLPLTIPISFHSLSHPTAAYVFFLIFSSLFPSIMCFRRWFLRMMWPVRLAYLLSIVCTMFDSSVTLGNVLQHPSLWKILLCGQQKWSVWLQWLISPSSCEPIHLLTFSDFILFTTIGLFSCLMARDQVSYPYKMKCKTVVRKISVKNIRLITSQILNNYEWNSKYKLDLSLTP